MSLLPRGRVHAFCFLYEYDSKMFIFSCLFSGKIKERYWRESSARVSAGKCESSARLGGWRWLAGAEIIPVERP